MFNQQSIIGVIGSGAMGSGIAQVAASAGHKVVIYDSNTSALEKAKNNLHASLEKLLEKQKISAEKKQQIISNSEFTNQLDSFSSCDLVIEAIVENLDVKKQVFSDLEKIVKAACVMASNTSSLSIASIASACDKPERVVGIHFFNPATLMPLVEIIPAIQTDSSVTTACKDLIDGWGKITVVAKDTPGFIVNRIARPYYGEAIRIYEEGIADFATIDFALKTYGNFKMGPFELMDFIGNDINYKVTETVWEQFFYEPRFKPSFTHKRLYEARRFGRKSGIGYYDYRNEQPLPEPQKDDVRDKAIFTRVLVMLINEAVDALYMNVASRDDIDMAMTKGVNYPKGLLKWCDEIGAAVVLAHLELLYAEYQEDRYRPSVLLRRMAKENKRFH
jgi:3-hydroxybutyryl-CoA dehydrogenase